MLALLKKMVFSYLHSGNLWKLFIFPSLLIPLYQLSWAIFYRAYLLRQEIKVSVSRGVGTVLAERLLDLIVLLLLFIPAIIVSLHENLPTELRLALEITLGAVVVGIAALFCATSSA